MAEETNDRNLYYGKNEGGPGTDQVEQEIRLS